MHIPFAKLHTHRDLSKALYIPSDDVVETPILDHNFVGMTQTQYAATDIVKTLTTNRTHFNSAGLLRHAPHNILKNANMAGGDPPTGWELGDAGADLTWEDQGTYFELTAVGDGESAYISFNTIVKAGFTYTVGAFIVSSAITAGNSRIINGSGTSGTDGFVTDADWDGFGGVPGWYAVAVEMGAADTTLFFRVGVATGGTGTGTVVANRPFIIKGNITGAALATPVKLSGEPLGHWAGHDTNTIFLPRLDSNVYNGSSWDDKGLGIWQSSTNICLHTEALDNAAWAKTTTTISAFSGSAPDGNATADDVIHTGSSGNVIQAITVTNNTKVFVSSFVQKGTTGDHDYVKMEWRDASDNDNGFEVWFKITDGTIGTAQASGTGSYTAGSAVIIDVENGYRIAAAGQIVSGQTDGELVLTNTTADAVDTAEETNSVAWWGHNVTESLVLLPYISAATAAVAVSADLHTQLVSTISGFNQTAGTIYAEGFDPTVTGARQLVHIDDGGSTDRIFLFASSATPTFSTINSSDTDGSSSPANTISVNTSYKMVGAYSDDDVICGLDGTLDASPDTSAGLPTTDALTTVRFGTNSSGGQPRNGILTRLAIYDSRLSDSTLITISTDGL